MLVTTVFGPMYRIPCSNGGYMNRLLGKPDPVVNHNKETAKLIQEYDVTERLDLAAEELELDVPPKYAHADLMMEAKGHIIHLREEITKAMRKLQLEQKKNSDK